MMATLNNNQQVSHTPMDVAHDGLFDGLLCLCATQYTVSDHHPILQPNCHTVMSITE